MYNLPNSYSSYIILSYLVYLLDNRSVYVIYWEIIFINFIIKDYIFYLFCSTD